jgi:hypothetical protein
MKWPCRLTRPFRFLAEFDDVALNAPTMSPNRIWLTVIALVAVSAATVPATQRMTFTLEELQRRSFAQSTPLAGVPVKIRGGFAGGLDPRTQGAAPLLEISAVPPRKTIPIWAASSPRSPDAIQPSSRPTSTHSLVVRDGAGSSWAFSALARRRLTCRLVR